jgi:F-type H+-transporting ATPase subunit delta
LSQTSQSAPTPVIAGEAAILARRYGGALYELADEQKQLDAVAADLRNLKILAAESAEFKSIIHNPRLTRAQLMQTMKSVSDSAKLSKLTANFLGLAAKNRRLNALPAMIDGFLDQLAESRGEYTAEVSSASALSAQQQEQLSRKLADLTGGKMHLMLREDKSLLGGVIVKMGSRLIDASVRTKLERLERQLKSQQNSTQKGAA